MELFKKSETREGHKNRGWHDMRVRALALALLIPTPALAKEVAAAGLEIERVEVQEDSVGFLERLSVEARTRRTETAWAHFVSPDGESYSTHTSVAGSEQEGSVNVNLVEAVERTLEGYTVMPCHTHPNTPMGERDGPADSYAEGVPLPSAVPSNTDIESFIYTVDQMLLIARDQPGATTEGVATITERFSECVMTSTGGYWTMRVVDLNALGTHMQAIEEYTNESFGEFLQILEDYRKTPEGDAFFAALPPSYSKNESFLIRALTYAVFADPNAPDISPELSRIIRRIHERKRPLQAEPRMEELTVILERLVDRSRPYAKRERDIEEYRSYVRDTFGIEVEWNSLPRE
jgi:hypothetical protein